MRSLFASLALAARTAALDVYGLQPVLLPRLPSGHMVLEQLGPAQQLGIDGTPSTLALLQSYVDLTHDEDEVIGGKLWPAVALMCRWLLDAGPLAGSRVLELGAGTGAGGLFASALGAAHVTLTDGGGEEVLSLLRRNAAATAHLRRGNVEVAELCFGDRATAKRLGARADWVLAADVLYGQSESSSARGAEVEASADAGVRAEALADTLDALLLLGCGEVTTVLPSGADQPQRHRPPRVVLAHEHRARPLRGPLPWDSEDDAVLCHFVDAATRRGLRVTELVSERPCVVLREPPFVHWSADLSLLEVERVTP